MIDPTIIDAMVAAGCTAEQLAAVMKADAAIETGKLEARKALGRARFHRWKERHPNADKRSQTLAADSKRLTGGDVRVEDKTSNLEIEPQEKLEQKETREAALVAFDTFWAEYPNKAGKPKARAAFPTALRRAKGPDAIMAGLRRYVATKPVDRAWLNPTTFLNQERWADEPAPMARGQPPPRPDNVHAAALRLTERTDAVTPSEIEGNYPAPRLVAIGAGVR